MRLQGLGRWTKRSETTPRWEPCCPGPHCTSLADGGSPGSVCRLARSAALAFAQPPLPFHPFPHSCLLASRTLIPSHCLLRLTHPLWASSRAGRAHQSEHPVTWRHLAGATSEPVQAWPPVPTRLVCTSLSEHWALFVHSRPPALTLAKRSPWQPDSLALSCPAPKPLLKRYPLPGMHPCPLP